MVKLISNTDSLQVRTKVLTEIVKDSDWSISKEQITNFFKILDPDDLLGGVELKNVKSLPIIDVVIDLTTKEVEFISDSYLKSKESDMLFSTARTNKFFIGQININRCKRSKLFLNSLKKDDNQEEEIFIVEDLNKFSGFINKKVSDLVKDNVTYFLKMIALEQVDTLVAYDKLLRLSFEYFKNVDIYFRFLPDQLLSKEERIYRFARDIRYLCSTNSEYLFDEVLKVFIGDKNNIFLPKELNFFDELSEAVKTLKDDVDFHFSEKIAGYLLLPTVSIPESFSFQDEAENVRIVDNVNRFFQSENYKELSKLFDSNELTPKLLLEMGLSMFKLLSKKLDNTDYYDNVVSKTRAREITLSYLPEVIFDVVSYFVRHYLYLEEFVDLCNVTQSELISFDSDSSKYSLTFFRNLNDSLQESLRILETEKGDDILEKTVYLDKDIHLNIDSFREHSERLTDISHAISQGKTIKLSKKSYCFVDLDKEDLLFIASNLTPRWGCLSTGQPSSILEIISNNPGSVIFKKEKDEMSKILEFYICGMKNNFFEFQSKENKFLESFFTILYQESKR